MLRRWASGVLDEKASCSNSVMAFTWGEGLATGNGNTERAEVTVVASTGTAIGAPVVSPPGDGKRVTRIEMADRMDPKSAVSVS